MISTISSETDHFLNLSDRIVDPVDIDIITHTNKEYIIVFALFAFVVVISCLSLTYGTITVDKILAITSVMMGMYSILKSLFGDKTQLDIELRREKNFERRHREMIMKDDRRHIEASRERLFLAQLILSNQPHGYGQRPYIPAMIDSNV